MKDWSCAENFDPTMDQISRGAKFSLQPWRNLKKLTSNSSTAQFARRLTVPNIRDCKQRIDGTGWVGS